MGAAGAVVVVAASRARRRERRGRDERAKRAAPMRSGRGSGARAHSVRPSTHSPTGSRRKPGALVEAQRALVVDLRVDERAARAARAHPAQAVGEEREPEPSALRVGVDREPLHVAGALGPAEEAVAGDRVAARDAQVRARRRARGLVEADVVELPEVVERGGVDREHRGRGRRAATAGSGGSGAGERLEVVGEEVEPAADLEAAVDERAGSHRARARW